MAGARHAQRRRGRARRIGNALCSALVLVGVGTLLLGGRASGYADVTEPPSGVLATGTAVVPDGLYPGAVLTGRLPVSNTSQYDARVTRVDFAPVVVDAGHPDCRAGSVVLVAAALPVVPGAAAQSIAFTVTMDPSVGDECQGASFTSGYAITARPV